MEEQSFKNHTKIVPGFVFFVLPALTLNLGWSLYALWRTRFSFGSVVAVLTAGAILLGFAYARMFAVCVQDRVIRLEERLRYERILPADLLTRSGGLHLRQIIALRFASDAELPGLMRKVLDGRVTDAKAIKSQIAHWNADHLRA